MDQSQAWMKTFRQVPTQIRACDWSMLIAFAFARNTLAHLVIALPYRGSHVSLHVLQCHERGQHTAVAAVVGVRVPGAYT
jgi:hypothetical protein